MLKKMHTIQYRLIAILAVLLPAICFNSNAQEVYKETFDSGIGNWINIDSDGDGRKWGLMDYGKEDKYSMASASVDFETEAPLTPDNWLISPLIDLSTLANEDLVLLYHIMAWQADYATEKYRLYINVYNSESDPVSINDFKQTLKLETLTPSDASQFGVRSVKLSSYAGRKIRIAFRHYESTNQSLILLDDIIIKKPTAGSDLLVEQIIRPYSYNTLGVEIPVTVKITNVGLEEAIDVQASYAVPSKHTVKESVPNIASGTSITYTFNQNISPYDVISRDVKIDIVASASNDIDTKNNSKTGIFNVVTTQVLQGVYFESDTDKKSFQDDYKKIVNDEYRVSVSMLPFFPANEAWTMLVVDDTRDFPTDYWGASFLAATSSFSYRGQADRWLVLPGVYLDGTQLMFGWTGATFSLGGLATNEEYQILISESGPALENFTPIGGNILEYGNIEAPSQRVVDISQYAGKTVHMAFRCVSNPTIKLSPTMLLLDNFIFYTYNPQGAGVDENELSETDMLMVYPNPVDDYLNVTCKRPISRLTLINHSGQAVLSYSGENFSGLNVSHLPPNLYLLKVESKDGNTYTKKILKK